MIEDLQEWDNWLKLNNRKYKNMNKTEYTLLVEESGMIAVLKDGKIEAKGFNDNDSALHAVWVLEGMSLERFYVADGLNVILKLKDEADEELACIKSDSNPPE